MKKRDFFVDVINGWPLSGPPSHQRANRYRRRASSRLAVTLPHIWPSMDRLINTARAISLVFYNEKACGYRWEGVKNLICCGCNKWMSFRPMTISLNLKEL